jgi:hypothetical protein
MKRKLLILLTAAAVVLSASAYSQFTFGVRAGVNFQNMNGKDDAGDKVKNDLTIGFNAGVNVELPVVQDFFLQPGLLFSTKGAKNIGEVNGLKASISYLELPINFLYKPLLGKGHLLLGFGPYVAYGIGGKIKTDNESQDIKFKNKVSESDASAAYLRPFDAGANILFGYEFDFKLSVQMNAQLGLLNLEPKYEGFTSKAVTKNTGFGISLGYRF